MTTLTILQGNQLIYLLLSIITLLMVVNTIDDIRTKRKAKAYRKKNDEEHRFFRKNLEAIARVLRRIENSVSQQMSDTKKMSNALSNKVSPLLSQDNVIKEMQRKLSQSEENLKAEKRLTSELARKIEEVTAMYWKLQEETQSQ